MERKLLHGTGVSEGIAIGMFHYLSGETPPIPQGRAAEPEGEIARFEAARTRAADDLQQLYEGTLDRLGESQSFLFQVHRLMLEDQDFTDLVHRAIREEGCTAELAIDGAARQIAALLSAMEDSYLRERSTDILDIATRLLRLLAGQSAGWEPIPHPVVLGAQELLPSQTVQLEQGLLLGLATVQGTPHSHTAILARTMGIPAVVQLPGELERFHGHPVILDGGQGLLIVDPDRDTLEEYRTRAAQLRERARLLRELRGKPTVTRDGRRVSLCANITTPQDLPLVEENDGEGIGLFRSEFLFLGRDTLPDEEEQFAAYAQAARAMGDRRTVIRTLDLGADKQADCLPLSQEANPALGFRGIRLQLARQELLLPQLRAICRASALGRVALLLPMVTSPQEVLQARQALAQVQRELARQAIPFAPGMEVGVMIETPAAALISDQLGKVADFFSIGTNDLTQYTLAADRQNQQLSQLFDPRHRAVLQLIRMAVDNAHCHGRWVGVCGELAADPDSAALLLTLGVDELSAPPSSLLPLREQIRGLTLPLPQLEALVKTL